MIVAIVPTFAAIVRAWLKIIALEAWQHQASYRKFGIIAPMFSLRLLQRTDARSLAQYHHRNADFHREWTPLPPANFTTVEFQEQRLQVYFDRHARGEEYRFGIFTAAARSQLIGSINLVAIERGAFQNGRIGYSVDQQYKNQGVISTHLKQVIQFSFGELQLHRLEASILPRNAASRRVLEKCGFKRIGYSPKYLQIQGIWQDHQLYMKLADVSD